MSDLSNQFVFDGKEGPPSGQFVRIIRQNALDKDKSEDDSWMARYAAARIDGLALEWLEEQTDETQDSWKLLRKALLFRWPPSVSLKDSFGPAVLHPIPTPAAAPPFVSSAITPSSIGVISTSNSSTGVLRAVSMEGETLGYLSKHLDDDGDYLTTKSAVDAQVVGFTTSNKPHFIEIRGLTGENAPWLGYTERSLDKNGNGILAQVTQSASQKGFDTSSKDHHGKSYPITWCVQRNGRMLPFWEEHDGVRRDLEFSFIRSGYMSVSFNFKLRAEKWLPGYAQQAWFIFDEMT